MWKEIEPNEVVITKTPIDEALADLRLEYDRIVAMSQDSTTIGEREVATRLAHYADGVRFAIRRLETAAK